MARMHGASNRRQAQHVAAQPWRNAPAPPSQINMLHAASNLRAISAARHAADTPGRSARPALTSARLIRRPQARRHQDAPVPTTAAKLPTACRTAPTTAAMPRSTAAMPRSTAIPADHTGRSNQTSARPTLTSTRLITRPQARKHQEMRISAGRAAELMTPPARRTARLAQSAISRKPRPTACQLRPPRSIRGRASVPNLDPMNASCAASQPAPRPTAFAAATPPR